MNRSWLALVLAVPLVAIPVIVRAGQPLETETARTLERGQFDLDAGIERQMSSGGSELAVPFALEYGLTRRTEILVEPVFFDLVQDKGLPGQKGLGDIEGTVTHLMWSETADHPALAIAGEVKIPTARNRRIGSGKTDFTGYLVASKRWGRLDVHANAGYTIVGHPAGVAVNNTLSLALAGEYRLGERFDLVAETFGSTAALAEQADGAMTTGESALTPEIGGAEFVGAAGMRYHATGGLTYSIGLSLDNQGAVLIHPGISRTW